MSAQKLYYIPKNMSMGDLTSCMEGAEGNCEPEDISKTITVLHVFRQCEGAQGQEGHQWSQAYMVSKGEQMDDRVRGRGHASVNFRAGQHIYAGDNVTAR